METNSNIFLLGNQPIQTNDAGIESYRQSGTPIAYSYLLVSADTSDGLQELFLYRKEEKHIAFVGKRKLPVSFRLGLAQRLTSVLFQQVWYCRQNPNVSLEKILRDFSTLFVKTEQSTVLLKQLFQLCTQKQSSYDYDALYRIMIQLLDKCQWNQDAYVNYTRQRTPHHPVAILFKSIFLDWLNFCQLAADFLSECKSWQQEDYPMLSFYCCGSSYLTALISYAGTTQNAKQGILDIGKNSPLFQQTEKVFQRTQPNMKDFLFRISNAPYEAQIVRACMAIQKKKASQKANTKISLYAEKALCLPKDACIHFGKWQGLKRTISSADGAEEYLMPAPLSEEFASLVASGKVKILVQNWTKQDNGWMFQMEYAYKDRTEENPYRPVEKYYTQEELIFVKKFPDILAAPTKGEKSISLLAMPSAYSVGMSNAVFDGKSLKFAAPEKLPENYRLYFNLFDSNQKYLGQFDCNMTPAKGGNA